MTTHTRTRDAPSRASHSSDERPVGLIVRPGSGLVEGRTGRGIDVAIIDSGINPGHPHVGGLGSGIAFDQDGRPHEDLLDRLGHGTAVAAAVHEKAPNARIHVARVFEEVLSTSIEALLAGFDWALARGARLVNLSLGTANPENLPAMSAAVEKARSAGAIMVSASEGATRVWYPGTLPGVVGVSLDWSCPREAIHLSLTADSIVVRASGYPRPIPGVPPEKNLNGVSFAVANATGVLACLLEGRTELKSPAQLLELVQDFQTP